MAFTESTFVLWTPVLPRSCRLFLVVLLVRIWRLYACERLMLPLPRTRKRFFAPLLVFILGMMLLLSLFAAHGGALRRRGFLRFWRRRLTGLGLVRVMRLYCHFLRGQQHHHLPPLQPRKLLDDAVRLEVAADALQQTDAEFLVRHLAAAETQRDLGLVAFAQEPDQVPELDLVIALVGTGAEFHFLDLDLLELQLRFVRSLRLAVLELAEIHDPADRRLGERRDFDQIEFCRLCSCHCIRDRHDADLLTVFAYQANLGDGDLPIDPLRSFLGYCILPSLAKNRPCRPHHPSLLRIRQRRAAASVWRRVTKASRDIAPRSSPARVRTATCRACISLSPRINWYGNFCRLCSRIL